jgi:DNA-binding IclR family transcriptional regulator
MSISDEQPLAGRVEPSRLVSAIELANELGIRKQTVFRIAKRLEIEQVKHRDPERGKSSDSSRFGS